MDGWITVWLVMAPSIKLCGLKQGSQAELRHRECVSMKYLPSIRMLIHPSIVISLLLVTRLVASSRPTTLAPYFAKKAIDPTEASKILKNYRHLWQPGVLTIESFKEVLEGGQDIRVERVLNELDLNELDNVLDGILHPSCTRKTLENLKQITAGFRPAQRSIVYMHVLIHQSWKISKETLTKANNSDESNTFLRAAGKLVFKASKHKRFTLIKVIFTAINREHIRISILSAMAAFFGILIDSEVFKFSELFILNDIGKYVTAELFRMLSRTETPVLQDFVNLIEHPAVDGQQFAKIINALLLNELIDSDIVRKLVLTTGSPDIPALRKHIKSEILQKRFLQHFDIDAQLDMDSAWSALALKLKTRHGLWRREHASYVFEQLEQIPVSLPTVISMLISAYAA